MAERVIEGDSKPKEAGIFAREFRHTLDEKNRLTIPSEWRTSVGDPAKLLIMQSFEGGYLMAIPYQAMQDRLEKLQAMSFKDPKARQLLRQMGQVSEVVGWDKSGRIRIDERLMKFAGITGRLMLVGTYTGFELWDEASYDAQHADVSMGDLSKGLDDLGIQF
jgi:MraZ protein